MREILIDPINPQPTVRKNAEGAKDWEFAGEAKYLYDKAVLIRERLIDPIARIDRQAMPDPIISFDNLRNKNTLAAYTLVRNPQGLNYEITLNTEHYEQTEKGVGWKFGQWALLETLAHEQVHEWQQTVGKDPCIPGKPQSYHNREFVDKCEGIGLHPMIGAGCHLQLADGPFEILMKELGVERPNLSDKPDDLNIDWFKWLLDNLGKGRKGTSTLNKWVCPDCGLNVRIGIKGNPELEHKPCGEMLVRVDKPHQEIYEAPEPIEPTYNQWDDPEDLTAYLEPYMNG